METVKADLVIALNVECPECGTEFNMLTETYLNDEGDLMDQVLKDDRWEIDADERLECSPTCPMCDIQFDVKGVNW